MQRLLATLALLSLTAPSPSLRAAETPPPAPSETAPPAYLEDAGKLLPTESSWTAITTQKLADFEKDSGTKILLRFHLKSPTPEEDKKPGAFMQALAKQLGTLETGVVAVYFADEDEWRVWIGDSLASRFAGRPGTARELTENGAIHQVKEGFLTAARAKSEATFAALQKSAPKDQPPTPGHRIWLQADILAGGLIERLAPK